MYRFRLNSSEYISSDNKNSENLIKINHINRSNQNSRFSQNRAKMTKTPSSALNFYSPLGLNSISSSINNGKNSNNSLRSTPDQRLQRQKFLKTPADVSRLNSYLHECSNNIEQRNLDHFKRIINELDDNYQSYSSQGIDCNCVFCGRQKLSSMRQNQSVGVDTRNFINGLNEHRTTVKVQRGFEKYPNMITDENRTPLQKTTSNIKCIKNKFTRKIDNKIYNKDNNRQKIELWNEKEVLSILKKPESENNNNINSNSHLNSINQTKQKNVPNFQSPEKSVITQKSYIDEHSILDQKQRLIQLFKEYRLDPYLSPLVNQLHQTHSKLINDNNLQKCEMNNTYITSVTNISDLSSNSNTNINRGSSHFRIHLPPKPPVTPQFYKKNFPDNPPVTPMFY